MVKKKAKKKRRRFREPKEIEAYHYLHANQINLFHDAITGKKMVDFSGTSLRGVDLRHHDLEGASLHDALISGAYFPNNLTPEEITMSVQLGTRLRTKGKLVVPDE